jgi:hypothetical protein
MKQLVVISSPEGAIEDKRLLDLAALLGVPTQILPLECEMGSAHEVLNQVRCCPSGLAMHMETLRRVHRTLNLETPLQQVLDGRFSEILIYGAPAAEPNDALETLTNGAIRGFNLCPIQTVRYSLPHEASEFCAQLAGQELQTRQGHSVSTFEVRSECGLVETIMAANKRPMFARFRTSTHNLFFLAGRMPDICKPLSRDTGLGDDCIPLLPPLIFLRHCFPENCWHGDNPTARLIIDDPLLTKNYGALDFETLETSMQRLGYGASIAFIPWNHWRSSRRFVARFLSPDSNLGICVHGCDHTNHEFQLGSASALAQKAALGIQRMEKHRKRVGATFEDVMVFPQGLFSRTAIPALRSANYLAAVNSTCFPTDYDANDIRVGDFLWPAVTGFNGFPIFQRRYPRNTFEFAFDLFLGKPALLVEHHEFFRDGFRAIEEAVAALQRVEPRLSWPSLSTQLMRSNLRRRLESGCTEVRFFTRRFQFVPRDGEQGRYILSKPEPDSSAVNDVLVDGKSAPFGFEDGLLKIDIESGGGQPKNVEVIDRTFPRLPVRSFGVVHNARVFLRRGLSEFRDNTLSHHKSVLRVAQTIVRTIKATGDS